MEPDERYHEPFIKPLLEQSGSAYTHSRLSGANGSSYWSTYDKIFDGKLLPKRERLYEHDPRLREPNYSLLVTGNIHRTYKLGQVTVNRVHYSNLIMSQMAFASQTNTMFHAYGLIRMLFWLPHEVETALFPRSLNQKSSLSISLENAVKMRSIVSPSVEPPDASQDSEIRKGSDIREDPSEKKIPRSERYVADRVLASMEQSNMRPPENRRSPHYQDAMDRRDSGRLEQKGHGWPLDTKSDLTPEALADEVKFLMVDVKDLVTSVRNRYRASSKQPQRGVAQKAQIKYDFEEGFTAAKSLSEFVRSGNYLDLIGRQVRVERQYAIQSPSLPEAQQKSLKENILRIGDTLRDAFDVLNRHLQTKLRNMVEEDFDVFHDPPISPYHQRKFEPLSATKEEFWPDYSMCLIDMIPRRENLASDITSADEGTHVMRDLAQSLAMRSREPLPIALDKIAPNAGADLIRDTPIITDPLRGGRMNAVDMTARGLTREMFHQLVVSYLEWPFRPSSAELASQADLSRDAEARNDMEDID